MLPEVGLVMSSNNKMASLKPIWQRKTIAFSLGIV
jgi:hypothetical protein